MDYDRMDMLDHIIDNTDMKVIPTEFIKHISMYDKNYGWVGFSIEDYEDLCNGEYMLEDFAPTEVEYHLDYDLIKKEIISLSDKIMEGL